ncbi:hypothetical protein [Flagellimonas sp.]|uniref:hypothetical protein n=1 Tax=Flagellimonas sp. TaxID=2058762 RepID=UPI003AB26586
MGIQIINDYYVTIFGRRLNSIQHKGILFAYLLFIMFLWPLISSTYLFVPAIVTILPMFVPEFIFTQLWPNIKVYRTLMFLGVFVCTYVYVGLIMDHPWWAVLLHSMVYATFGFVYSKKFQLVPVPLITSSPELEKPNSDVFNHEDYKPFLNLKQEKCEWCLTIRENDETDCSRCGGPVLVLEPWIIQCGWCSSSNRRDLTTHCNNCGGPLPHIPGTPRLPKPTEAPRKLPKSYENRVRYWKNVHFIVGIVFMLFLFTIVFPIIGFFLLRYGIKKADNQIYALKHGVCTRGIIEAVYEDTSQHINGVHPICIEYSFVNQNEVCFGAISVWDETHLKRPVGEHQWVVYNTDNTDQNSIWPPLW